MMRVVGKIFGWMMISVAGLGVVGLAQKPADNVIGVALVLGMIGVGGLMLIRRARVDALKKKHEDARTVEQDVLRAAKTMRGRVTAAEVAADSGRAIADVQAELERLERSGVCASLVGESGIIVYLFHEFEDPGAKHDIFHGDEERKDSRGDAARRAKKNTLSH